MTDLFESFNVSVSVPFLDNSVPLDTTQRLVQDSLPEFYRGKLSDSYLAMVPTRMQKTGTFAFICARCNKIIPNTLKLHFDEGVGMLYGLDCYARIQAKQEALKLHHLPNGGVILATLGELQPYICSTTHQEFQALPANVQFCGSTPRTCTACPGTALRNKHRKCDFELAMAQKRLESTYEPVYRSPSVGFDCFPASLDDN